MFSNFFSNFSPQLLLTFFSKKIPFFSFSTFFPNSFLRNCFQHFPPNFFQLFLSQDYEIVMSGQFRTLAMFCVFLSGKMLSKLLKFSANNRLLIPSSGWTCRYKLLASLHNTPKYGSIVKLAVALRIIVLLAVLCNASSWTKLFWSVAGLRGLFLIIKFTRD